MNATSRSACRRSRAGVSSYRKISHDAGCDCFLYSGPLTRIT